MKSKLLMDCGRFPFIMAAVMMIVSGCSKILDKQPLTQTTWTLDSGAISASDAEDAIAAVYAEYKGYDLMNFNIFDRICLQDVRADNCYAGGDNTANITIDNFTETPLNGNLARDWSGAYTMIGKANISIDQIEKCVDPALSAQRKEEMLAEARFIRAFVYFDMVRLWGRVPLFLKPADTRTAETLLQSTLLPQSSTDSVYLQILDDLWYAKERVRDVSAAPDKFTVAKGTVYSTLAKVYAAIEPHNWDSVLYYCNLAIPDYSLVPDFSFLWDNNHKNNSEAIWELNYFGYYTGDYVGNWIPSINVGWNYDENKYEGGGWKKFNTPTNDLVDSFEAENDNIRLNNSITFLDVTGQWTDPYWPLNHYPFLTKYNDPANGTNDVYMIRLADILLLKAEALANQGDLSGALELVNQVRARVNLPPKSSSDQNEVLEIIANERRLELAFEGHRWYDLVRTGKALEVMNSQTDGQGHPLNYNVQPYELLYPIPQEQLDLNPLLTQNPGY
jgi:hypothetical protein